jgi:hypothetical protein
MSVFLARDLRALGIGGRNVRALRLRLVGGKRLGHLRSLGDRRIFAGRPVGNGGTGRRIGHGLIRGLRLWDLEGGCVDTHALRIPRHTRGKRRRGL